MCALYTKGVRQGYSSGAGGGRSAIFLDGVSVSNVIVVAGGGGGAGLYM